MKTLFLICFTSAIMFGLSYQVYQAQGQSMEPGKKPVSYQIGSKGGTGYSVSGPGYQAQGQQSGNGDPVYVISDGMTHTILTYNLPTGYKIINNKEGKPLVLTQRTGLLGQLQGVVDNRTLLQGQKLPGMGQLQGMGPSVMLQGQQMGGMMQMQG